MQAGNCESAKRFRNTSFWERIEPKGRVTARGFRSAIGKLRKREAVSQYLLLLSVQLFSSFI